MSLKLKTAPASLAELMLQSVCDHLRHVVALDESPQVAPTDLAHIERLTEAAVALLDGPLSKTRRALLTQTWTLYLDAWPAQFVVPLSPLQSVTSVKYYDADGELQTLATVKYIVTDLASWDPTVTLKSGETWPVVESRPAAIELEFVAGYGDDMADVPAPLLQAVRMLVAEWYETREAITFSSPLELPFGVRQQIQPYRIYR